MHDLNEFTAVDSDYSEDGNDHKVMMMKKAMIGCCNFSVTFIVLVVLELYLVLDCGGYDGGDSILISMFVGQFDIHLEQTALSVINILPETF